MQDPIPFQIDLEHISISGWRWGKGHGTTVLALHGWLDNCASFTRLAPQLALECDLDIWAIDMVGHGHSSHRPQGSYYHIWDNVIDLTLLMDAQGWEKVDLLGHSMGAGVATLMAGAVPERIARVALLEGLGPISTPAEESPGQLTQALSKYQLMGYKQPPSYADIHSAAEARMRGVGEISYEAALPLTERGIIKQEDGWYWRSDPRLRIPSPVRLTEEQINAFCNAITAPVRLLTAEQGFLVNRENTEARAAHVRNIQHQCLPGNHHFHLEPETYLAVQAELIRFWQVDQ